MNTERNTKMSETNYYKVAGHVFGVTAEASDFGLMRNYEPFVCEADAPVFVLTISSGDAVRYAEEFRQEEEGQEILCGRTDDGRSVFEFRWWQKTAGWLVCSNDYHDGRLIVTGAMRKSAIDNALMLLFATATADRGTVLFHAAAVSHNGYGYMFLGKSGTGKSTHARLWMQYTRGTELMNDDNPVVRIEDEGCAFVYGSPWSGKTPCYRQVKCPLGGIVQLSQAPHNRIEPLNGLVAYATLVSSISGMRWSAKIADGLHQTENMLVQTVPMWHLECLPDEAAAILCHETIATNR